MKWIWIDKFYLSLMYLLSLQSKNKKTIHTCDDHDCDIFFQLLNNALPTIEMASCLASTLISKSCIMIMWFMVLLNSVLMFTMLVAFSVTLMFLVSLICSLFVCWLTCWAKVNVECIVLYHFWTFNIKHATSMSFMQ